MTKEGLALTMKRKRSEIKTEFPNEVDILRSTLADVKTKLPGLDVFLLANPECSKCSNSKAYHCVQVKGKPGCRTCSGRRISCTRHVQYLVETTASRLDWSIEKTRSMYDKHVKQTRSGKKSLVYGKINNNNNKKVIPPTTTRKATDAPQTVGSGPSGSTSRAHQIVVEGKGKRRNVVAPEEDDDDYEGEGGSDYQDGARQVRKDLENFSDDDPEEDDDDDDDDDQQDIIERNKNAATATATTANNNIPNSISNAIASSSKPRPHPSDPTREETPSFIIPVLESEETASLDLGQQDPTSLRAERERTDTADDLTRPQLENEGNETGVVALGAQSEHTPESSMSAEQRIKQLEEKVEKLNALRVVDAASISRLEKRADTAFDNMSVLLSHVRMYRKELGTIITQHIETAHQKPFKPLINKMDETSVSAMQILMLLDSKRKKNYVMPKSLSLGRSSRAVVTDEEGQEWVPWDVISDDNNGLRDNNEMEMKRKKDDSDGVEGEEGSSKRRKC